MLSWFISKGDHSQILIPSVNASSITHGITALATPRQWSASKESFQLSTATDCATFYQLPITAASPHSQICCSCLHAKVTWLLRRTARLCAQSQMVLLSAPKVIRPRSHLHLPLAAVTQRMITTCQGLMVHNRIEWLAGITSSITPLTATLWKWPRRQRCTHALVGAELVHYQPFCHYCAWFKVPGEGTNGTKQRQNKRGGCRSWEHFALHKTKQE